MTPDLLRIVGTACFGRSWQLQIAEALGVGDRTMRRFMAEEMAIPDGIRAELHAIVLDRIAELQEVAKELERDQGAS